MTARSRKPLLVNLTWAGVALVLLYVVSVGPACWMTSKLTGPYSNQRTIRSESHFKHGHHPDGRAPVRV
jgi:hypothetical protein